MGSRFKVTILAAILGGVSASAALAQTETAGAGQQPPRGAAGMMKRLDTNKDGFVDQQEFLASKEATFKATDANGDGFVSLQELTDRITAMRQRGIERSFKRFDTNGDGKISAAELAGTRIKRPEAMMKRADTNGDGSISMDEFRSLRQAQVQRYAASVMRRFDTDKDGRISRQEADAQAVALFKQADKNGDGKLDASELTARFARGGMLPAGNVAPAPKPAAQ
ncbi:Ca2+-binding protein, EF-hand superfamily [Faunimonas pinastri]|uniref:Ca2+-binding protein, EF-hand superfamily n=1 Tax=Faunimonas pinastri TaxID=1855383 RepID=A0A1H9L0C6_9HYPH|nr:EF-hand domain-containing protein [Faunimonas pinastri]SER04597.1 Ca2+-binding protein, EF-hand superfamily [Faunimonas pinastri]